MEQSPPFSKVHKKVDEAWLRRLDVALHLKPVGSKPILTTCAFASEVVVSFDNPKGKQVHIRVSCAQVRVVEKGDPEPQWGFPLADTKELKKLLLQLFPHDERIKKLL